MYMLHNLGAMMLLNVSFNINIACCTVFAGTHAVAFQSRCYVMVSGLFSLVILLPTVDGSILLDFFGFECHVIVGAKLQEAACSCARSMSMSGLAV